MKKKKDEVVKTKKEFEQFMVERELLDEWIRLWELMWYCPVWSEVEDGGIHKHMIASDIPWEYGSTHSDLFMADLEWKKLYD